MTTIIGAGKHTVALSNTRLSEVVTNQVYAMTFLSREVKPHTIYINKLYNIVADTQDA